MITLLPISSLDYSSLAPYRTLRQMEEHVRAGIFVAEGSKVVQRLLQSEIEVVSALVTPRWWTEFEALFQSRHENICVHVAEHKLLEEIIGIHAHQGAMAVGRIRTDVTLAQALSRSAPPRLLVAVDGLCSAENVGVVMRNCAAFGVNLVIIGETAATCWLRRAVRNSMGAVFGLPVHHTGNLVGTLQELRSLGVCVVGATPHTENALNESDLACDCCVVVGHEGDGIRPRVLDVCDQRLAIAMSVGVDSLNVANAVAVFLYEVRRQQLLAKT